jgi:DNA-binding protein HU-beta
LNKQQLIKEIAANGSISTAQAAEALELVLDTLVRRVLDGDAVSVTGFGKLQAVHTPARHARNPQTGDASWSPQASGSRSARPPRSPRWLAASAPSPKPGAAPRARVPRARDAQPASRSRRAGSSGPAESQRRDDLSSSEEHHRQPHARAEGTASMTASVHDIPTHALASIPAAHRGRATVTAVPSQEGVLITFTPRYVTSEERAAVDRHELGSKARRRAEHNLITSLAREAHAMRGACARALRAAGYDVTDEGRADTLLGLLEGFALRSMRAVPVAYGQAFSPAGRAWQSGVEHGWDHAAFVRAYGTDHDRRRPAVPSYHRNQPEAYEHGWREGRKRFNRGCYTDNTPRS